MAPCTGNQSQEDYHRIVEQVRCFLEGRDKELLDGLRKDMEAAADREEFEMRPGCGIVWRALPRRWKNSAWLK